jgi:triphosphoribosyl-dephospho-CoA synthase
VSGPGAGAINWARRGPSSPAPARALASIDPLAAAVDRAALAALHEELITAPKPGLVTPGDRGAHHDMDAATFFASLRALRGLFADAYRLGAAGAPAGPLRALGVGAELRMLSATRGVNTHRGAIFTLGVLAAAAGRLAAAGRRATPLALRGVVRDELGPALLGGLPPGSASHGQVVAARHGAGGARQEALAGFPHLFEVALPTFETSLARGSTRRAAAVECLLALVAVLPDTNLLWRGGEAGLAFARAGAADLLARGGLRRAGWEADAAALHRAFVARRLSPGGSADLLAATLFVHRLAAPGRGGTWP